ncbi:uncharacterized protein LOC130712558 [Lotus japonicus]|uniref:uncharacterized protein LOC130712558 n=1 Tax=Lotus japonicus TaxID=34305 RepID=UPI00258AE492|nr:uncharacterized protein LOC130712558 [Lotus japonicus]
MNQRNKTTTPRHLRKYIKLGALAKIRDARISARSKQINFIHEIPINHALSSSQPSSITQHEANSVETIPLFLTRIHGPHCPQRKRLTATKPITYVPINPSIALPDLAIESFGNDVDIAI